MIIHVGGEPYEGLIDESGRLVFKANHEHYLVKQMSPIFGDPESKGTKTPNDMVVDYHAGKFSFKDYAEMNIAMGYSVAGFAELSHFWELEIRCEQERYLREGRQYEWLDEAPGAYTIYKGNSQ